MNKLKENKIKLHALKALEESLCDIGLLTASDALDVAATHRQAISDAISQCFNGRPTTTFDIKNIVSNEVNEIQREIKDLEHE